MYNEPYLSHHGIKGMKWGIRKYYDKNGNLTDAGRKRYSGKYATGKYLYDNGGQRKINKNAKRALRIATFAAGGKILVDRAKKGNMPLLTASKIKDVTPGAKAKKIAIATVAAVAVTATYAIGAKYVRNLQYRNLEYGAARADGQQLRITARRYLKSQGINV